MISIKNGYAFFCNEWPSNWRHSPFILNGIRYNCVEQYMMAEKCRCFGDFENEAMVMSSKDPVDQKRYGRLAGPYNESKWAAIRYGVVLRGTLEKYRQNPELRQKLLDPQYDGITFVEARVEDTIWGIGLRKDDPRAWDSATWWGQNLLGRAITEARGILQREAERG